MEFNSIEFFRHLTLSNKLAVENDFRFCIVSGLDGFEDALHGAMEMSACVAVDDTSGGGIDLTNTPHKQSFRTVYLFMRHTVEDNWAEARQQCFDIMRELVRQFASVIIRERTRLRLDNIVLGDRITFQEIDRYFFTGGACAFFQIEVDKYISLEINPDEWLDNPIPPKMSRLDVNTPLPSTPHCLKYGRKG